MIPWRGKTSRELRARLGVKAVFVVADLYVEQIPVDGNRLGGGAYTLVWWRRFRLATHNRRCFGLSNLNVKREMMFGDEQHLHCREQSFEGENPKSGSDMKQGRNARSGSKRQEVIENLKV